jgi:hypothetical protein
VFYFFTGINYRILAHITDARNGSIYVNAYDTANVKRTISVAKYRRLIGDMP